MTGEFYLQRSLGDSSPPERSPVETRPRAANRKPDKLWSLEGRFRTGKNSTLEVEYGRSTDRPGRNDDVPTAFMAGDDGREDVLFREDPAGADYWGISTTTTMKTHR